MSANTAGKPIRCKAAVLPGQGQPFVVEEVVVDPPKAGEVRIKVVACGVCHSDASAANGLYKSKVEPIILGHEGAGFVESVGEGVKSVKPGDPVIIMYTPYCAECDLCTTEDSNMCRKMPFHLEMDGLPLDGTSRFTWRGKKLHHFMHCSAFSQYTVTPELCVAKVNPKAPLEKVCLLGCGIPTGYGASINKAQVKAGSTVGVWGLGGVGLGAVMGAKVQKAKRIIGVDINPDKFELAKKFGCTEFVNPKDHSKSVPEVMMEMTGGLGLDFAIECVGSIPTLTAALDSVSPCTGKLTVVGAPKHTDVFPVTPLALIAGKTINGGCFGGYKGRRDIPGLVEQYLRGELMIDEFITHTMPLDKINEAFELMKRGESIRAILTLH